MHSCVGDEFQTSALQPASCVGGAKIIYHPPHISQRTLLVDPLFPVLGSGTFHNVKKTHLFRIFYYFFVYCFTCGSFSTSYEIYRKKTLRVFFTTI
jgi:hypothetical protein